MKNVRRQSAFTLVELLMVVAVIGMLLAFVVPNARNFKASRELTNGGNAVVDMVNHARRIAMTENVLSALIFIKEKAADGTDISRRYILYQQLADRSGWKPVSRWENLPVGVYVSGSDSEIYFTEQVSLAPPLPSLRRGGDTYIAGSYVYQVFLPNGALLLNANREPRELHLRLEDDIEGTNYFNIIINSNTGIPVIRRP